MLIYNTTFHCESSCYDEFIKWLQQVFIPGSMEYQGVSEPRLARILSDESEGVSLSVQFCTPDMDILSEWYSHCGDRLIRLLENKYSGRVAGFTTIMEQIEL